MKTVTVDDGVYGVPVSIETYVMFYNKKLVSGDPASSFEQLLKKAKSFNNAAQNKFWFLSNVSEGATMFPMLS
ncbi:extracellular solute-binding protein, partial [Rhodanobacter denitrificans]|uniref:extracellular solute-binding protein n=1 Tax=Rhodanobacter denitrificans TaxID=666685 RepID=UPI000B1A33A3